MDKAPDSSIVQEPCDVSVVVALYNEEKNILELFKQIKNILEQSSCSFELIFVDDGSTDESFDVLKLICSENKGIVTVLQFSRNFGQQIAICAGLKHSKGRCAIVCDADLQDPPQVISQFIGQWKKGYDIVYGQRKTRGTETIFKKLTARIYYRLLSWMANTEIPENFGDFYLLDRKVIDVFNSLKESHRYNRGLVAWVGFKRIAVEYDRQKRLAGQTKYSLTKMVRLALDGILSFTFIPLHLVFWLGFFLTMFSLLVLLVVLYFQVLTSTPVSAATMLFSIILFLGSIQILSIGILGEYLSRIGDDTKARPLYIVRQILR